jgi:hypothetical protein
VGRWRDGSSHSDSRITRRYAHLAGVMFQDEAERMGGSARWNTGQMVSIRGR